MKYIKKMIPRLRPQISSKEFISIAFTRKTVEDFEFEFAKFTGQKYAIAFPYGRTALYVLMKSLGFKKKEIITPAYTCVVVPNAITKSGNIPKFVDCKKDDPNMNLDLIRENITNNTGAIIATSIFGNPLNIKKLDLLADLNIPIIQDCAHSFITFSDFKPTHKEGLAAFFGLNFGKMITSIFGGMITTDDYGLAKKIINKRNELLTPQSTYKTLRRLCYFITANASLSPFLYRFVFAIKEKGLIDKFVKYYDEEIIDMPIDFLSSLTNVEAKVGIEQLKKFDNIKNHRRIIAELYDEILSGTRNIKLPKLKIGSTFTFYSPRVPKRDLVIRLMASEGIELGNVLEYSIPYMKSYLNLKKGEYKNSLNYANTVINLPIHINKKEAIYIAKILKQILNKI